VKYTSENTHLIKNSGSLPGTRRQALVGLREESFLFRKSVNYSAKPHGELAALFISEPQKTPGNLRNAAADRRWAERFA
jgi:hypothetical protein